MSSLPITTQVMKETRWRELSDSLVASRADGNTDVILVCHGRKFPAHRFLLEMSSSYFQTMFRSGLEESKSGITHFRNMEPETLDAVLDYLYKGEVEKVVTEEQIKKVLGASHMMNLTNLFEYCCFMLGETLSKENFRNIQKFISKYETTGLTEKVLAFAAVDCSNTIDMVTFQHLSDSQMKTMLTFAKSKHMCFDKLLTVLLHWLQYDLKVREKAARGLFKCVDAQLVSKSTIRSLLVDGEVPASSQVISNLLKDLALACTLGFDPCSKQADTLKKNFHGKELNITFFSKNYNIVKSEQQMNNCVQQFDLTTMSWLPPKMFPSTQSITGAVMCYFNGTVYMVGGDLNYKHLLYDIAKNVVEVYLSQNSPCSDAKEPTLCVFKNFLYIIGGMNGIYNYRSVFCVELGAMERWHAAVYLCNSRASPTVLTSTDYIYVIGGCTQSCSLCVERSRGRQHPWERIDTECIARSFMAQNFVVVNHRLHVVGFVHGRFECWLYNENECSFQLGSTHPPDDVTNNFSICQFSNVQLEFMLLSTRNNRLPTHVWEPLAGKWMVLDAVRGACEIPNFGSKPFVLCADF